MASLSTCKTHPWFVISSKYHPLNCLYCTELSLDAFSHSQTCLFFQLSIMHDSLVYRLPSHLLWDCVDTLGQLFSLNSEESSSLIILLFSCTRQIFSDSFSFAATTFCVFISKFSKIEGAFFSLDIALTLCVLVFVSFTLKMTVVGDTFLYLRHLSIRIVFLILLNI